MISAVRQRLDPVELGLGDRLVVAEVEAQPVRADVRAGLLDVGAEHLAQRPVQDVGRGVVAADRVAARSVDRGDDLVALDELALLDLAPVDG